MESEINKKIYGRKYHGWTWEEKRDKKQKEQKELVVRV